MFIYAIGVLPLIQSLRVPNKRIQLWYADDASAGGSLSALLEWFSLLCSWGLLLAMFHNHLSALWLCQLSLTRQGIFLGV